MICETIVLIVVAWLIADFTTGFWHWLEDRYFDARWPLIGEWIAKPNELHHSQPQAFLQNSYWWRNCTVIVPAAAVFAIALLMDAPWWILLAIAFVSQGNEVHAWEHRQGKLPWFIALMQETGILQSTRHHAQHHKSPHAVNYCVLSNWLNPWLDGLGFWLFLQRLLAFAGIKAKEG